MLLVELSRLVEGPVETRAELDPRDELFERVDFTLGDLVRVAGRLQSTGDGRYYWRATLRSSVTGECRRCLAPVTVPILAQVEALFSEDPEALDDPAVYPVAPRATSIDLRPAVREELILAVPAFLVCREECRGLCPRCGADLNAGPCGCAPSADPRWSGLETAKPESRD